MRKILFLWHIIFLPITNIYRRVALNVIGNVGCTSPPTSNSPILEMYRMAWNYDLGETIWQSLLFGATGTLGQAKQHTKRIIWAREHSEWQATCIMHSSLYVYSKSIQTIRPIAWWMYAKDNPDLLRKVCCTVSLLMGSQPAHMQCNNASRICKMCSDQATEGVTHILMKCKSYEIVRLANLGAIMFYMPAALKLCFSMKDDVEKVQFLISGLQNSYVKEWSPLYRSITNFVYDIYKKRKDMYDIMEEI